MSSESSPDPIESAAKGFTKGTLEWTHEKLKEWIIKLKNRDLAFIKDIETINLVKEQRETGEWDFFKKYVNDNQIRILFQMGLTLKKLEKEKKYSISMMLKVYTLQSSFKMVSLVNILGID